MSLSDILSVGPSRSIPKLVALRTLRPLTVVTALGFVIALAVIGCGDGSDGVEGDSAPATATEEPSAMEDPDPTPMVVGDCRDGMSLQSGEGCRYTGGGEFEPDVVLWVRPDGQICRVGGPVEQAGVTFDTLQLCSSGFERDDAFESDIIARENADGSWTFHESAASASADRSSTPDSGSFRFMRADAVSLSEFDAAAEWEREIMFSQLQIARCEVGLVLPRDGFCIDDQASSLEDVAFLVAHLPDGDGLILQGGGRFQAGGAVQLGWITFEREGADWVITHLEDP